MDLSPDHLSELLAQPADAVMAALRAQQLAIDYMNQGIVLVDAKGRIALANRRSSDLAGLPAEKMGSVPDFREIVETQWNSGEYGSGGTAVEAECAT